MKKIGTPGISYIWIDGNKITFTTDTPKYCAEGIEQTMEELFSKFDINKFEINMHYHKGKMHDKDISFNIKDKKKIKEITNFIIKNFYKIELDQLKILDNNYN